jgi:rod shape-determining protein MreC
LFKLLGNKRLFILLFALIFFIAVMGLTIGNREAITWPEKFIADSVTWTQSLISKPAAAVAGFFRDFGNLRDVYEENRALKEALAYYARDVARLNTLERENARLKEALGFTERQKSMDDYKYRIARVISFSTDPYNNTIRIDLGSTDGIEENMAVVSPLGLVGRVSRVAPFYSTVELITNMDPGNAESNAISATVRGKEDASFGIIDTYDREANVLIMSKIELEDPLAVGDIVVTSGFGGIYPPGITIGTVLSRETKKFGTITHTAEIRPAADFSPLRLREVFVVEVPKP